MNVFLIHGAYGSPNENWLPWLKTELEKKECKVIVPCFPTPENQSLENWLRVLKESDEFISNDTIFVAHSLGAALVLRKLELIESKAKACFFVASFLGKIGNPDFDEINKSFFEKEFNWEKIKSNCEHFEVMHSDNDPFVPLENGKQTAEGLGVELEVVKGAGHFNSAAGFKEFPLLLKKLDSVLNKR